MMKANSIWRGLLLAGLVAPAIACGEPSPSTDDDLVTDPDAAVIGDPDAATEDPDATPLVVDAPVAASSNGCDGAGNTFAWTLVEGASYQLEYTPAGGAAIVVEIDPGVTSYAPIDPLPIGDAAWRVRAQIDGTYSVYASATLTVVAIPATPEISPYADVCEGDALSLEAVVVDGATYAWALPDGSDATGPVLDTAAAAGTYTLSATVDGCASAPASVEISFVAPFGQSLADEFLVDIFANTSVEDDSVTLRGFAYGDGGDGAFLPVVDTELAGGDYAFTDFIIPIGVVVTVTGDQPLRVLATGTANVAGTLRAEGGTGGNGVTYTAGGAGAAGVAGGADGGAGSFSQGSGPIPSAGRRYRHSGCRSTHRR